MGGRIIDDEFTDPDWEPDGLPPEWEKEQARFWEDQRDQADSEDGERAGIHTFELRLAGSKRD